jgi:hypothetical protein
MLAVRIYYRSRAMSTRAVHIIRRHVHHLERAPYREYRFRPKALRFRMFEETVRGHHRNRSPTFDRLSHSHSSEGIGNMAAHGKRGQPPLPLVNSHPQTSRLPPNGVRGRPHAIFLIDRQYFQFVKPNTRSKNNVNAHKHGTRQPVGGTTGQDGPND